LFASHQPSHHILNFFAQRNILLAQTLIATWIMPMPGSKNQDFKDPDTGQLLNRELLNRELTKNREARGHRQPEGLPQRGGQVLAAVAGTEQRQEPVLDQL
jgi:hypothetical protein